MCFSSHLAGGKQLARQLPLIYWELEKYGPGFGEPPATQVVDEAMQLLRRQLEQIDSLMPEHLARFHGSVILQRKGREALNASLAACARVASVEATTQAHEEMLYDAAVSSLGQVSISQRGVDYHLGPDEARELAESGQLPEPPSRDRVRADLAACVSMLARPRGWTPLHAIAFVLHAAHMADRQVAGMLTPSARLFVTQARKVFGVDDSIEIESIVTEAAQLLQRCGRSRFVFVRALEDQLMHLAHAPLEFRALVVQLVNSLAGDGTLLRRHIVSTTMGVLATSPNATQRRRDCPAWPL
jgi:hypothetical protein